MSLYSSSRYIWLLLLLLFFSVIICELPLANSSLVDR